MLARPLGLCVLAFAALVMMSGQGFAAPAAAPDSAAARAFVQSIYDRYPSSDGNPPYFGITRQQAVLIEPGLLALIREDQRLGGDYEGAMAYDPFCHCTHDNGAVITIGDAAPAANAMVVVPVVVNLALPDQPPSTVRLRIYVTNNRGKLQVYDVVGETGGIRAFLTASNRRPRR